MKELEDDSLAVGFCNFDLDIVDLSYTDFSKLGLNGMFTVRDLWRQKNICNIDTHSDKLYIKVPAREVLFYKFSSAK